MKRNIRKWAGLGAGAALLASGLTLVALPATAADLTTVTLAGNLQQAIGCTDNWQPTCEDSVLEEVSPGVYENTFTLPAGTYEYKVVFDGSWEAGGYPGDGQPNRPLTIGGDTELKFTYMTKTDDRAERLAVTPVLEGDYTDADNALVQKPVRQPGSDENFYFVIADRFNDGDPSNNYGSAATAAEGGFDPTNKGYYFGGDIKGLEDKLDYIQGLGTSAIWLAPMFKNQAVQGEGANESAGYHGYWITDFTQIDPHFGTNEEMKQFIDAAHAKGIKVYFDIITNHTADIIYFEEGQYTYKDIDEFPYYDAEGNVIDVEVMAKNRTNPWPALDALTSFPYTPVVSPGKEDIKVPSWLNDVTLYHNRGNSTWEGESVTFGDFDGLDDLMTEHPTVVNGFIDVYNAWIDFGIDGFRIDTVKHVNFEFWEDWTPAIAQHAVDQGNDDFFMFGEVYSADQKITSPYVRKTEMSSILDFAFQAQASTYATGASARTLDSLFASDAYFTTPHSSANALPTFLGNHDMGRIGFATSQVNNSLQRDQLAHQIMYLTRGQPVVYYGDEQGFAGTGDGKDKDSRQPLFGDKGNAFGGQATVDGKTVTAEPMFNQDSVMYKTIAELANVRDSHPALKDGAQIQRYVEDGPGVYAFSRVDEDEKVEYLVAVNNATSEQAVTVPTLTSDASFTGVYGSTGTVSSDADGNVAITVPALSSVVWAADKTVDAPSAAPAVTATVPHPGVRMIDQQQVSALINPNIWQQTSFSWRVVGSDTWTDLGASESATPTVYHDLGDLPTGTLVEYRAVTTDAAGNHAASSTYGSVGIAVGLEDDPGAEFEIYMVGVPGNHQLAMGCSGEWMPACEESKLTLAENGVYTGTFDLPAGTYEYKVALNGSWDLNYGVGGVEDGGNATYTTAGGPVTFYWDPVTKIFTNNATDSAAGASADVIVLAGDFQDQLGCEGTNGGNWQPWCFGSLMDSLGDGKYEFTTDQIVAGNYQVKATRNLGWDDAVGTPEGENISFTVSEDNANLKFTFDDVTKNVCIFENGAELYCSGESPVVPEDEDATLALNVATVEAGNTVEATVEHFEANEPVNFVLATKVDGLGAPSLGEVISVDLGTFSVDENGALTTPLTIPEGIEAGDYVVQARGSISDKVATAALEVTVDDNSGPVDPEKPGPEKPGTSDKANLTVDRGQVAPGDVVTVTGTGFKAGETVKFTLKGSGSSVALGTGVADASGSLVVKLTIPADTAAGDYTLEGVGQVSGLVATVALKVSSLAVTGAEVTGIVLTSLLLLAAGGALAAPAIRRRRA